MYSSVQDERCLFRYVPFNIEKKSNCRGAGAGGGNRPLTAQQAAGGWKPDVKPVGAMPTQPAAPGQIFTQTSLAKNIPVLFEPLFAAIFGLFACFKVKTFKKYVIIICVSYTFFSVCCFNFW